MGDLKWGPEGGPNGGSERVQMGSRRGSEGGPGGHHDWGSTFCSDPYFALKRIRTFASESKVMCLL